jgi:hypothetical protein
MKLKFEAEIEVVDENGEVDYIDFTGNYNGFIRDELDYDIDWTDELRAVPDVEEKIQQVVQKLSDRRLEKEYYEHLDSYYSPY